MSYLWIISIFTLILLNQSNAQKKGVGSSYQGWGYADVRPGAHMFWWLYFTTNTNVKSFYEKPLIVWVEGGPGGSGSGQSNFMWIGPYDVKMKPRNNTWVKDYNVLFIDGPIGTGFSYADNHTGFATTDIQFASDMLETLRQVYKTYPNLSNVPTYIMGHSYGGKMSAVLGLAWYKAQKAGTIKSNLLGIGCGNPAISTIHNVLHYGQYLWETGMVDSKTINKVNRTANEIKAAIDSGNYYLATYLFSNLQSLIFDLNMDINNILTKKKITDSKSDLNILDKSFNQLSKISNFPIYLKELDDLMNTLVKNTLKLNVTWNGQQKSVIHYLAGDFIKPITHMVDEILEETSLKVVIFSGHMDLNVNTPGTLEWIKNLKWKNINDWIETDRTFLVVNDTIEGYINSYNNFSFISVYRAGHGVLQDNVPAMFAIIDYLMK